MASPHIPLDPGTATVDPAAIPELSEADLSRILATPTLSSVEPRRFPENRSLRSIIRRETRIVRFAKGDIVVRDGDYGSSVFVILSGTVRVLLDSEGKRLIGGRRQTPRRSFWQSLSQHWRRSRMPERRDAASYQSHGETNVRWDADQARIYVKNVERVTARFNTVTLTAGQIFGEVAALTRSPRTATIFADDDVEVAELRWQGLREIRRRDIGFRQALDDLYRSRDLSNHLRQAPIFAHLDDPTVRALAEEAVLESYGELEWSHSFKRLKSEDSTEVVEQEELIAEEGHYVDGLIIVRSGFARVSKSIDHGHRTVGYLAANEVFGLEEIVSSWRRDGDLKLQSSLRAVGYVDVLRIPTAMIEDLVLPSLPEKLLPKIDTTAERLAPAWSGSRARGQLEQTLVDALVDNRVINGQAAMIIDTDRCVDCDECVTACAVTHDNNPRFVRHGPSHAQLMFTTACMHCVDPVCLIGCPTGAIHRSPEDLRVLIDDPTCIGCGTCADACPYDNIRLVEARDSAGGFLITPETGLPVVKATKCDLCVGQLGGPACERACPHDALIRIDLHDRERLARWVDGGARVARRLRSATLAVAAIGAGAILNELWEGSLRRGNLFSGWVLLTAIVFLVLFALRKKLPGLPLLSASAWLRAHVWTGWFAVAIFALHGGLRPPSGLFESVVWLLFVVVAGSGAVGIFLSRWIPPRLDRYGERVLFERIPGARRRLADEVQNLAMLSVRETASSTIIDYYTASLAHFFAGPRNLIGHLVESNRTIQRLRRELHYLERYLDPRGREILDEIGERILAKDNLDRQYALHLGLRSWRRVHGPATIALTAAIVVHVVLVLAFSGGA